MVTVTRGESIADPRRFGPAAYNLPMNIHKPLITPARLHSDLAALNAIGRDPATDKLARPAGSAAAGAAEEWLRRRAAAAGFECQTGEDGFTVRLPGTGASPVVLAGELGVATGAGPFDGALGLVAGLEILRSVPESANAVALGSGTGLMRGAQCVFHCAVLAGSMLADSGRQLGVALSTTAPLSMQRVCEIGEESGVAVLPVPLAAVGVARPGVPACVLVVDAGLNCWPITQPGWMAVTACANLLAHLVADLADS